MFNGEKWNNFVALLNKNVGHHTYRQWLIAIGIALLIYFVLLFFRRLLARKPYLISFGLIKRFEGVIQRFIENTQPLVLLVIAIYTSLDFLEMQFPKSGRRFIDGSLVIAVLFQILIWGNYIIELMVGTYADRHMITDADKATTIKAAGGLSKLVLWFLLALLAMDNLGFNITTLWAGLGIGGVAVALSAQKILGDLFASLSIVMDKPFVLGDFVTVGEDSGTIERIGLKTTRIRSLSGEELIFPNSDILQSRIHNFKRMEERRVCFSLGVTYQTTYEQLKSIPGIVTKIIESVPKTRVDRVNFKTYSDSALQFEVVYFVLDSDMNVAAGILETINLEIYRQFASAAIQFAYPTRVVHLMK